MAWQKITVNVQNVEAETGHHAGTVVIASLICRGFPGIYGDYEK